MKNTFFSVFVAAVLVLSACNKKAPFEPVPLSTKTMTPTITVTSSITKTSTVTPTFTVTLTSSITETSTVTPTYTVTPTVTPTITPDARSVLYGFEGGSLYGWEADSNAPATLFISPSAAQAHSDAGSLGVACAYSAGNDLVQVVRSFEGYPVNLSGKNMSFYVFLSSTMLAAGTFHPEAKLVNYDGTVLLLANGPDMLNPGWNQASFAVPAAQAYEMIEYVYLGIRDDSGGSYNGYLYIDDITW